MERGNRTTIDNNFKWRHSNAKMKLISKSLVIFIDLANFAAMYNTDEIVQYGWAEPKWAANERPNQWNQIREKTQPKNVIFGLFCMERSTWEREGDYNEKDRMKRKENYREKESESQCQRIQNETDANVNRSEWTKRLNDKYTLDTSDRF